MRSALNEDQESDGPRGPLLTVICPLKHYYPEFLTAALKSLKDQTDPNWLLLIVVECQEEQKFELLLRQALTDPRISLLVNDGLRMAGAFNTGIKCASTSFVAALLGDDMWTVQAVDVLNQHIRNYPDVDFFYSSRQLVDEKGKAVSDVIPSRTSFSLEEFRYHSPVKHLLCWRRSKGLEVGGMDEQLGEVGPDDYDFPWTMAEHEANFMAIKECLYLYRNHCKSYRLTTHLTRRYHKQNIRRMLHKHGINRLEAEMILLLRRWRWKSFGIQQLYGTELERWLKNKLNYRAEEIWKKKIND